MAVFLLLSRLLLAAVLGVAGIAKLLDREGSRRALLDFGVPARLARQAAIMLPLVELGAAAALVPNASGRWGAIAALVLLGTFSVAIGAALVRGRRPSCHCFGRLHSAPAGWPTLLRNAGLGALAGAVVLLEPRAAVLTGSERLIVLGSAAVVAVVGALRRGSGSSFCVRTAESSCGCGRLSARVRAARTLSLRWVRGLPRSTCRPRPAAG